MSCTIIIIFCKCHKVKQKTGKHRSRVKIVEGMKSRKSSQRGKKEPGKSSVMEAKGEGHFQKEGEAAVSIVAESSQEE